MDKKPEMQGRNVICHTVVLADVHNAGAVFVPDPSCVVTDNDLVTGRSLKDITLYCDALLAAWRKIAVQTH